MEDPSIIDIILFLSLIPCKIELIQFLSSVLENTTSYPLVIRHISSTLENIDFHFSMFIFTNNLPSFLILEGQNPSF